MTLVVLEGVWGSGKTTLANALKTKYRVHLIKEPHHIKAGIKTENKKLITEWYERAHKENIEKGARMALSGRGVVLERSVLSSIGFKKILSRKKIGASSSEFKKSLENIRDSGIDVCFGYLRGTDMKRIISHMKRSVYMKRYADAERIQKLDIYLLEQLQILKKKKIIRLLIQPKIRDFSKILD